MLNRRDFLATSVVGAGFAALRRAVAAGESAPVSRLQSARGPLALPPGFEQVVISRAGEEMSDGLLVPDLHDGMAAFPGPDGGVVLVRNHELVRSMGLHRGPFGPRLERLGRIDRRCIYDAGADGIPCTGGTTTVLFDPSKRAVRRQSLSLAGTTYNCAGGPTPWGTWISCEEWTQNADRECAVHHGWCFEVGADPFAPIAPPKRLDALGRFRHEAVAVSADGGVVYLTEDIEDGCLYRFLPTTPGNLSSGRLQALAVIGKPKLDTRNWPLSLAGTMSPTVPVGSRLPVRWIDLTETHAPTDDLRLRAAGAGAATFARAEGIWHAGDAVYVAATTGGPRQLGQIWRYVPSVGEGGSADADHPGFLELFIESRDQGLLKNCDNLVTTPWGELFVCEDGEGRDGIVRITPAGRMRRFALNVLNDSELAGPCFSPDGKWFFVNIQQPGLTVAVTGPWETLQAS